jgi:predicted metal-binding protein
VKGLKGCPQSFKRLEMKKTGNEIQDYEFLADKAREAGAADARIIPAAGIVVEDRVRQKCSTGCYEFGKSLTCPPYAPAVEEFRKSLADFQYALIVKFRSGTEFKEEIRYSLFPTLIDPAAPKELKESAFAFIGAYVAEGRKLHRVMLELEGAAFNAGYPFALTTICGPGCRLCESCNVQEGKCIHPTMKRFSPEALGINVVKTAAGAGMPIHFPALHSPERIALMLID